MQEPVQGSTAAFPKEQDEPGSERRLVIKQVLSQQEVEQKNKLNSVVYVQIGHLRETGSCIDGDWAKKLVHMPTMQMATWSFRRE